MQTFSVSNLGGWSISEALHQFILDNVPVGSTILELGSGYGTQVLSENYQMISIEHDMRFVDKYPSRYIHAPLIGHWYDINAVTDGLSGVTYDAILVDGPPGDLSRGRIGFFENLHLFNTDVMIIFDDTNRSGEQLLLLRVLEQLSPKRDFNHLINNEFSVIYRKPNYS